MIDLIQTVGEVLAASSSSSEEGNGWLLVAGPLAGGGLYGALWQYYRNTNKSHQFERDTAIASQPATGTDDKVGEVKETTDTLITGSNVATPRVRVSRVP